MDANPLPDTELMSALAGGASLISVNNRLARHLLNRYDRHQSSQAAWEKPTLLPWRAWLRAQYTELVDAGGTDLCLLTSSQEKMIWEQEQFQPYCCQGPKEPFLGRVLTC